ncbi:MAG: NUDIX hydrolase [Pseudomonadota bacterium]
MSKRFPHQLGPWTVQTTQTRYENPWIRVEHSEVIHPDGTPGLYGVIRFANLAIGVLPIDETGHVWLVGQHRFPADAYSWELPEGGSPKDEDPLMGARRELKEETGYSAAHWSELARFTISNSVTDEEAVCYIAAGLSPGQSAPDASEDLKVKRVPFKSLYDEVLNGTITDSLTIIMTLMAVQKALRGDLPPAISMLIRRQINDNVASPTG